MRTIYLAIQALSTLILLVSCNKEDEIVYTDNLVDQNLISYYFFNSGSYWIYQDHNFNLDSVVVESTSNDFYTWPCYHGCPSRKGYREEYYIMYLKNMSTGDGFNYFFFHDIISFNGHPNSIRYPQYENGQTIFKYDAAIDETFNGATVIAHIDTLNILGNMYYGVTKMNISADSQSQFQQEFIYDTDLYFSENIGLVKKEVFDTINGNQVFNLKRYNIK